MAGGGGGIWRVQWRRLRVPVAHPHPKNPKIPPPPPPPPRADCGSFNLLASCLAIAASVYIQPQSRHLWPWIAPALVCRNEAPCRQIYMDRRAVLETFCFLQRLSIPLTMLPWRSLKDGGICKASARAGRSFFSNLNSALLSASLTLFRSKQAYS